MRGLGPDDICALCDEYSVKNADPAKASAGMGRCLMRDQRGPLHLHVEWNGRPCVLFRLDRPNLVVRRQYVALRRRESAATEGTE